MMKNHTPATPVKRLFKYLGRSAMLAVSLMGLTACGSLANLPALLGQQTIGNNETLPSAIQNGAIVGSLSVNLDPSSGWGVQSTASDVATLVVEISRDGQSLAQDRMDRDGGQGEARFDGLSPGSVSIHVDALDARGSVIGGADTVSFIQAGRQTSVAIAVHLRPTVLPGGALAADIQLIDGPVLYAGVPDDEPDSPAVPIAPLPSPKTFGLAVVAPVAGGFANPEQIAFDADHTNLYVANLNGNSVSRIDLRFGGRAATTVYNAHIPFPNGLCVDKQGNVWVTRRIDHHSPSGDVPGTQVYRIDPQGHAVAISGFTSGHWMGLPDENAFWSPTGIVLNPRDGRIYVANSYHGNGYIDSFDPTDLRVDDGKATVPVHMYVGPGTLAPDSTGLSLPDQIAFAKDGTLWIADQNGPVRTARPNGAGGMELDTFCPTHAEGLALTDDGIVALSNNWGNAQHQNFFLYGPGGKLVTETALHDASGAGVNPTGLALSGDDQLFLADYMGGRIMKMTLPQR